MKDKEICFPRSEKADMEVGENLRSTVDNISPSKFISIVESARRIATIYSEESPTSVRPGLIQQEAYYLDSATPEKQEIKENLNHINAIHLAVDPLVIRHATSVKVKLDGRIDREEIVDFARREALHSLRWNLDLDYLAQIKKEQWIKDIPKLISSHLVYLLENILKNRRQTIRLDNVQHLIPVVKDRPPEDILIQKEEVNELLEAIDSLSFGASNTIYQILANFDGTEKKKIQQARESLTNVLGRGELLELSKSQNSNGSSTRTRTKWIEEPAGMSIFQGLELGQIFWIITKLPVYQQLAVYYGLGYLDNEEPVSKHNYSGNFTIYRHRAYAKNEILKIRGKIEGRIPCLEEKLLPYVSEANGYKAEEYADGTLIPKHSAARLAIIEKSRDENENVNYLSNRQRSVVELVIDGLRTEEIAEIFGISESAVTSYISTAAKVLTSQNTVRELSDGTPIPNQSSARLTILDAVDGRSKENLELLSDREKEVFELVVSGISDSDIAESLDIAIGTASSHISKIAKKLV